VYADHCLLTSDRNIMADINRIFAFLDKPIQSRFKLLRDCKTLLISPTSMRRTLASHITGEIKAAQKGLPAAITLKMNSLSDNNMIDLLYDAAKAGVQINLIVRGIFCMQPDQKKFKTKPYAVSLVDQYLEHSRVLIFHNKGKEKVYLSSADWMVRNLDHRIEAAVLIKDATLQNELKEYLNIQLKDNVKARILNNQLSNLYAPRKGKKIRSQIELYEYLHQKMLKQIETGRHRYRK
ncbi:MAG: phospholipase D-like domain-containing protein, partial [Bacteroidota bacterium]